MEIVISFVLGMLVATLAIRWAARRAINKLLDAVAEEMDSEQQPKRIKMRVEEDNKTYFMYNVDDGAFVCQGVSIAELREHFQKRFPGYQAEITGDSDLLQKLANDIKALNENSSSVGRTS